MKIYLAGPYVARDQLNEYADELRAIGYTVVSTWLAEKHEINDGTTGAAPDLEDSVVSTHARTDLNDIDRADVLVLFTLRAVQVGITASTSGGRHVETGYAIARGIPVLVVGEPENVFHRMSSGVHCAPTWHAAVIDLAARLVSRERETPSHAAEVLDCQACRKAAK